MAEAIGKTWKEIAVAAGAMAGLIIFAVR